MTWSTEMRVKLDKIENEYRERQKGESAGQEWAKYFELSLRNIQMARMWIGKMKGEEGSELPPEYADKAVPMK